MGSLAGFERGPGFRRRQIRTTPAAITDPSIFTAEARAVGQLGRAVAGAGVISARRRELRNNELAKADFEGMKADTAAGRNEFLRSLRTTDESYDEINKRWGDFKKKTFKTVGNTTKQRKAQQAYGNWARGVTPQWDQDVDNIAWAVSANRAKVKVFNSAVGTLRTAEDFNVGLFDAGMAIEKSNLLTSEEKDLTLANAVIETNPQWYLDNVDAEDTKELFDLLSSDQKRTLEIKARESINRIRVEQTGIRNILETETRKTASDLKREGNLSSNWLEANRVNMSGPDYERYNNELIKIAEKEKANQARLAKIKDPFNREVYGKLIVANTVDKLDALQDFVDDLASIEQRKLSVSDATSWTNEIDERRKELIMSEANSYPEWARLTDLITEVQAGTKEIEFVRLEIDRAGTPSPGQDPKIVPQLVRSLRTRLAGIERNLAVKKRPSLTRAHSALGRLRELQISGAKKEKDILLLAGQRGLDLKDKRVQELVIAIENSFTKIHAELDEYADTVAGDKDFDDKINEKLRNLTEPIREEITLGFISSLLRKEKGGQFFGLVSSEEKALVQKKIKALRKEDFWKTLTDEDKAAIRQRLERGDTVDNIVRLATQ